ncbi:protein of unknown function [Petrocella atlantisensis]|uniref:Uncharacterized protein n=1 Tax=Petrocella atlantisensis TaxID=2173034 RepID=A0A3P7P6Q4_9FIRM|nr:protein of unknown function [Petrocella atlantisensis]
MKSKRKVKYKINNIPIRIDSYLTNSYNRINNGRMGATTCQIRKYRLQL